MDSQKKVWNSLPHLVFFYSFPFCKQYFSYIKFEKADFQILIVSKKQFLQIFFCTEFFLKSDYVYESLLTYS